MLNRALAILALLCAAIAIAPASSIQVLITLFGDVTGPQNATVVVAIHGTTVPINSAANQTLVTTASAVAAWETLPACTDTGGNHLNYNNSTQAFTCGTSSSTASLAFSAITNGTNTAAAMVVGVGSTFNINQSGVAGPTMPTNSNFSVTGASASNSRITNVAYAGTSFFTAARIDGTPASPTTIQAADQLGGVNAWGYNGTALVGPVASFRTFANQNWTGSAQGTYADITTTPNGTTAAVQVIQFGADGGITVPSTVTGGDKGVGTLNAGGLYVNGVAVSTTTGTVTSVNASFATGLITVTGGPITTSGSLTFTVAGTSGGIAFFNTATSWSSSAALAAGGVVLGGGAGTTPATDTHLVYTATNGLNITSNTASGTNGYGLQAAAPTGATNNYAASFTGGQVLIPDGTSSLPAIAFTAVPTQGLYRLDSVTVAVPASFSAAGTLEVNAGNNAIITTTMSLRGSVGVYGWTSGGIASTGNDTGFSRGGVRTVDVGNGTAGNTTGLINFAGGTILDPTATTGASLLTITPGAGQTATSIVLSQSASHSYSVVGAGIIFKVGSNARTGTGTLSGGTLAVANTSVTANSQVFIQDTGGGTVANIGNLYVASQTATTGFTVTSTNVLDNSTFRYWIFETN